MSKGIYIPGITSEQFMSADLDTVEELMSHGDVLDCEPNGWMQWIPIESETFPDVDEEGMSKYILLSFENFSSLLIGHYTEDEEGGMFHIGNCTGSAQEAGLIVDAWMPLPERYDLEEDMQREEDPDKVSLIDVMRDVQTWKKRHYDDPSTLVDVRMSHEDLGIIIDLIEEMRKKQQKSGINIVKTDDGFELRCNRCGRTITSVLGLHSFEEVEKRLEGLWNDPKLEEKFCMACGNDLRGKVYRT